MFQPAALQIFLKFPPHELRQRTSVGLDLGEEIRIVVVDDSVEKRLFGPVACVRHAIR